MEKNSRLEEEMEQIARFIPGSEPWKAAYKAARPEVRAALLRKRLSEAQIRFACLEYMVEKITQPRGIRPCPFCGNSDELFVGHGTPDREGIPQYIACEVCGANGPWVYLESVQSVEAVVEATGWNNMSGRKEPQE